VGYGQRMGMLTEWVNGEILGAGMSGGIDRVWMEAAFVGREQVMAAGGRVALAMGMGKDKLMSS